MSNCFDKIVSCVWSQKNKTVWSIYKKDKNDNFPKVKNSFLKTSEKKHNLIKFIRNPTEVVPSEFGLTEAIIIFDIRKNYFFLIFLNNKHSFKD